MGWGHSSITDTMVFAAKAGVGRVMLFHHDPYHDDGELEDLLAEARAGWPGPGERVQLTAEGMTIVLEAGEIHLIDGPTV